MDNSDTLVSNLSTIAAKCAGLVSGYKDVEAKCDAIEAACDRLSGSFSGSFIGYHSRVYYEDYKLPPPHAYFDVDGGLQHEIHGSNTRGNWVKMNKEVVVKYLLNVAQVTDLEEMEKLKRLRTENLELIQTQMRSVFSKFGAQIKGDSFLLEEAARAGSLEVRSQKEIGSVLVPNRIVSTRDEIATQEGLQAPPHLYLKARAIGVREPYLVAAKLQRVMRAMEEHLKTSTPAVLHATPPVPVQGKRIFIGHGRSLIWRELKDFLKDELHLEPDEFNREPTEGRQIGDRIRQMLDEACFAFIIFTAEDSRGASPTVPRLNVVHETGLFQGRLGFEKAIVLLEDGCEKFSNIDGLVYIPFPLNQIGATFEKIRRLLRKQGLIP